MKTLVVLRKYMYFYGILHREPPNGKTIAIISNCAIFTVYSIYISLNSYFIMFVAHTFSEYSESLFYLLCSVLVTWWYNVYLWNRDKYVELLNDLDQMIEESE